MSIKELFNKRVSLKSAASEAKEDTIVDQNAGSAESVLRSESAPEDRLLKRAESAARWLNEREGKGSLRYSVEEYVKDKEFLTLLGKYEPDAALRIYEAERGVKEAYELGRQEVIDEIYRRRQMPKPMRGSNATATDMDFLSMSGEEFARLRDRLERS